MRRVVAALCCLACALARAGDAPIESAAAPRQLRSFARVSALGATVNVSTSSFAPVQVCRLIATCRSTPTTQVEARLLDAPPPTKKTK